MWFTAPAETGAPGELQACGSVSFPLASIVILVAGRMWYNTGMIRLTIAGLMAIGAIATTTAAGVSYFRPVTANWSVTDRAWMILQFFDGRVRLFWVTSWREAVDVVPVSPGPSLLVQPVQRLDTPTEGQSLDPARGRDDPSSFVIRVGDRRAVGPFGGQWRSAVPRNLGAGGASGPPAGLGSGRIGQGAFVELSYVRMPFWIPVFVLLFHPVRTIVTGPWLQRRRRRRNQCVNCGYLLTGNTSGICPECGTLIREKGRGLPDVRT